MPSRRTPWNKGKLVGQKTPLRLSDIWSIRVRLQLGKNARDLALFNLAIDSKLRGCDLVSLRLRDISHGSAIAKRAATTRTPTNQTFLTAIRAHARCHPGPPRATLAA